MTTQAPRATNRLRELREEHGLKDYDVAALVRRDTSMIHRYERGLTRVPEDVLRPLCAKYGVTVEYLLGWDRDASGVPA